MRLKIEKKSNQSEEVVGVDAKAELVNELRAALNYERERSEYLQGLLFKHFGITYKETQDFHSEFAPGRRSWGKLRKDLESKYRKKQNGPESSE